MRAVRPQFDHLANLQPAKYPMLRRPNETPTILALRRSEAAPEKEDVTWLNAHPPEMSGSSANLAQGPTPCRQARQQSGINVGIEMARLGARHRSHCQVFHEIGDLAKAFVCDWRRHARRDRQRHRAPIYDRTRATARD